jgi:hypothetical protein
MWPEMPLVLHLLIVYCSHKSQITGSIKFILPVFACRLIIVYNGFCVGFNNDESHHYLGIPCSLLLLLT